jgi:hypothetical protein
LVKSLPFSYTFHIDRGKKGERRKKGMKGGRKEGRKEKGKEGRKESKL